MNKYKTTLLFSAVVAITVSLLGVNGLFAIPGGSVKTDTMSVGAPIMGHVTLTLYDSDGNLKAYRQTDNLIVDMGENCIAEDLFGVDASTSATLSCGGTTGGTGVSATGFQWVGVGTSATAADQNQGALVTAVETRTQDSSLTFTQSTGSGASGSTAQVIVDGAIAQTATQTIQEAGLFDASTSGNMFARQTFSGISVVSGDSLTVKWTITIGS